MPRRTPRGAAAVAIVAALSLSPGSAAGGEAIDPAEAFATPEALIAALYDEVTFPAGGSPDWDRVRSMFLEQATVVLRTSRAETTIFTVDGFVQDFIDFIEEANIAETGFQESVLRVEPLVFGDMAHLLVLYEAHIPGAGRPPSRGVDSFQLIRKQGRWWIVSVTNEVPTPDRQLPPVLSD